LDARHRAIEGRGLDDAAFDEGDPFKNGFEAGRAATRQVVEDDYIVPPFDERPREVVPDEAGTAGDEGLHPDTNRPWRGSRDAPGRLEGRTGVGTAEV
jgi:hypothetical protein